MQKCSVLFVSTLANVLPAVAAHFNPALILWCVFVLCDKLSSLVSLPSDCNSLLREVVVDEEEAVKEEEEEDDSTFRQCETAVRT